MLAAAMILSVAETAPHPATLFVEIISVTAAIVGSAAGAAATWFGVRRKTSGRIGTSDADILWQQNTAMRDSLLAQLEKVTQQRDRLIESQASQVLPLMAGMIETLRQLGTSVNVIIAHEEAEQVRDESLIRVITANAAELAAIREWLGTGLEIRGTAVPPGENHDPKPPEVPA